MESKCLFRYFILSVSLEARIFSLKMVDAFNLIVLKYGKTERKSLKWMKAVEMNLNGLRTYEFILIF